MVLHFFDHNKNDNNLWSALKYSFCRTLENPDRKAKNSKFEDTFMKISVISMNDGKKCYFFCFIDMKSRKCP